MSGYERGLTTLVNDIEHIESQTLAGISVVKIFFRQGANIDGAVAQVTAFSQTSIRSMPPGTNPPLVITYNASSVPVMQLALSGQGLSEQQLFDFGNNSMRTQLPRSGARRSPSPTAAQRQIRWIEPAGAPVQGLPD